MSEIIVALIVAISSICATAIQYGNKSKKKSDTSKNITNEDIRKLRDEKIAVYNDREELYNNLTLAIAKNICGEADRKEVVDLMNKCKDIDVKYKQATDDYIGGLTKMVESS